MGELIVALYIAWASQYSPGVMEQVVANRQSGKAWVSLPESLPGVDGFAAVADCYRIGDIIYLRPVGTRRWERFLIADCARPPGTDGSYEWMVRNGIVAEVDYPTAVRWDTVGRGIRVEVGMRTWRGLELVK